jgi:tryptophan-rich sensory protein
MEKYLSLSIQPVHHKRYASSRRAAVFTVRPWHILQWMRDPEEWISRIGIFGSGGNSFDNPYSPSNSNNSNKRPFQPPDPLLYPSTWSPLLVLTSLGVIRAMSKSLWGQIADSDLYTSRQSGVLVMRQFILSLALHAEWYRVLVKEKRVALGVFLHALSTMATLSFFWAAVLADGVAGVLIVPSLLASIISGWMNLLLYWERHGVPPALTTAAITANTARTTSNGRGIFIEW